MTYWFYLFNKYLKLIIVSRLYRSELTYSGYNAAYSINSRPLQFNSIYEPSVDRPPPVDRPPSVDRPSVDKPPSYNEACAAAPAYETSFNKVCLFLFKIYNENRKRNKISEKKV